MRGIIRTTRNIPLKHSVQRVPSWPLANAVPSDPSRHLHHNVKWRGSPTGSNLEQVTSLGFPISLAPDMGCTNIEQALRPHLITNFLTYELYKFLCKSVLFFVTVKLEPGLLHTIITMRKPLLGNGKPENKVPGRALSEFVWTGFYVEEIQRGENYCPWSRRRNPIDVSLRRRGRSVIG